MVLVAKCLTHDQHADNMEDILNSFLQNNNLTKETVHTIIHDGFSWWIIYEKKSIMDKLRSD